MNYPYNSRTDLVEGSSLTASFLSSLGNGVAELVEADADFDVDADAIYYPTGQSVLSAEKIQRGVSIFDSRPIYLASNVTSWKDISWVSNNPEGSKIYVYVRTAATEALVLNSPWSGPFLNADGESLSEEVGKTIQFRIVMESVYDPGGTILSPAISSMSASCFVKGTSQKFYTSRIGLDFIPKNVMLTYNGTIPDDTILQFGITTTNTSDLSKYMTIEPNTITDLGDFAKASFVKLAISVLGNTEVPFVVDEFALTVSGDGSTILVP